MTRKPHPQFDVTSIGEVMMRLSVGAGTRLTEATTLNANIGGAESNVTCALAGLDRRTGWFGPLPDSPLGYWALRLLRASGVYVPESSLVPIGRLGVYFVELGMPPLPVEVTYDRANSVASRLSPRGVNWDLLLDTQWLHLTGITPALGELPSATTLEALGKATDRGVKVCFDVNYRSKLWTATEAYTWVSPCLELIDVLVCGVQDARTVFGLSGDPIEIAATLATQTRGRCAVVTLGGEGAVAWASGRVMRVSGYPATVLDRLGAGDAFAAGLLDGLLDGQLESGLQRGAALGAAALAQHGDVLSLNRLEMEQIISGRDAGPRR